MHSDAPLEGPSKEQESGVSAGNVREAYVKARVGHFTPFTREWGRVTCEVTSRPLHALHVTLKFTRDETLDMGNPLSD